MTCEYCGLPIVEEEWDNGEVEVINPGEAKSQMVDTKAVHMYCKEEVDNVNTNVENKKFKWYLHDDRKESVYAELLSKGFTEEKAKELIYSFHEVEIDCIYKDGKIYATHFQGKKLEEPVEV